MMSTNSIKTRWLSLWVLLLAVICVCGCREEPVCFEPGCKCDDGDVTTLAVRDENGDCIGYPGFCHLACSLPSTSVTITTAEVVTQSTSNLVQWVMGEEQDNDFFTVERSKDGENFNSIGTVESVGNSAENTAYSFLDEDPLFGLSFYRVSIKDIFGEDCCITEVLVVVRQ